MRRTSHIDVDWPDGMGGAMRLAGRARDRRGPGDGGGTSGADSFEARLAPDRTIVAIDAQPSRAALADLAGHRAGGRLRQVIATLLPEEREAGTPLHLLLDDIPGISLIAPWAWSLWTPDWLAEMVRQKAGPETPGQLNRENICAGLRTGSSGLSFMAEGIATDDLPHPEDPEGWHAMPDQTGPGMRRARRIDVWIANDRLQVDSAFQDSAMTPTGPRSALHEYRLRATADPVTLQLLSVDAEPRVLPFAECPAAAGNVSRLVGASLGDMREAVLSELRGTLCCTHLNDALRALADVPVLAAQLAPVPGAAARG
jgi:hypothetical protein